MIVEHISYNKMEETYDSTIFTQEKHTQPIEKAYPAKKHVMDYVFPDSKGETEFAGSLDSATEVCVYAKLPRAFQIPTPVGNYAPDWAIAFNKGTMKPKGQWVRWNCVAWRKPRLNAPKSCLTMFRPVMYVTIK